MKCNNCLINTSFEVVSSIFSDLTLALLWPNGAIQAKSTFGIDFNEKEFGAEREKKEYFQEKGRLRQ